MQSISKDASGAVTSMTAALHLEGDVKKTKYKITWLASSDELVNLTLAAFDHLITKKKVR